MRSLTLKDAISYLNSLGAEYALLHEAAITAWGINNNVFLKAVDIVVSSDHPLFDKSETTTSAGTTIRIWRDSELLGDDFRLKEVWSKDYHCHILDPEIVLELLSASPDAQYLLESRARLAMILYADKMTDEELLLFNTYVRGY